MWSTLAVVDGVSLYRGEADGIALLINTSGLRVDIQGMVRGPRNLMRGVRSAWTAACRRARVAENIVTVVWVVCRDSSVDVDEVEE